MHLRPAELRTFRAAGERGAATLEYVAAVALASLLVVSLVVALTGVRIEGIAEKAICSVRTALDMSGCSVDDGSTPPNQPPFDPKPKKCKITEHSEKVSAEVKILFIKVGDNAGFVETTYSDGTVTYTATDGAEVGVEGGFGTKLDVGKLERGAKVDFGAGVKFDYGSTWVFKDAGEATAMRGQLDKYLMEQETLSHDSSGGYAIYLWIHGATDPPKPPSQQVTSFEVKGDVTGKIGLSLPFDTNPDKSSGVPDLKLAEAGLKFGASRKWTQIKDLTTGATTWTTAGEVYGQANASLGPLAGELKGVLGSSMAIVRDKDNQITRVTLVTTREGKATGTLNAGQSGPGAKASQSDSASAVTITTASLDVTTPEQRALVDQWLAAQGTDPNGAVSPQTYLPSTLVPGDAFQNLMYTNATVSNVQYDNVSSKTGFAAEVKLGVAFGIDLSLETTDSRAVEANYLDAPGAGGVRPPVPFNECIAK
jgi:hypothetical protein